MVTYTEPGTIPDDNGDLGCHEIVTREEPQTTALYDALRRLICFDRQGTTEWKDRKNYRNPRILITHEDWDDGYSSYTITSQWQEVIVTAPELDWEHRWGSMGFLFCDLAPLNFDDMSPEDWTMTNWRMRQPDDHGDSNTFQPPSFVRLSR